MSVGDSESKEGRSEESICSRKADIQIGGRNDLETAIRKDSILLMKFSI